MRYIEILRGRGVIVSIIIGVFIFVVFFMFGNGVGRINDICIIKYDKLFSLCIFIIYWDVYVRNNDICLYYLEFCGGRYIVYL